MSTVQGAAPGSAPLLHLTSALVSQHPWSWEKQQQASTTIAAMAAALQQQHLHLHAGRRQRTPPFCPAAQCCRRRRCAAPPPRSVGTTQQQQQDAQDVLAQLLDEVQGAERGAASSAAQTASILAKVAALKSAQAGATTTAPGQLSATWKLLWTTEKETLFICQNAPLFGTRAGDVYQVIDVDAGRLQNVITFPPAGAFIVDSSIAVDGPQRVSFKFTAAKLKTASRDWGVPPFGQGWFDTIYLDDNVRIAEDIRGDTLIVARDGPPRIFT